ncbi:DUF3300 domain-containing protein [Pseudidiomarina insulisalsae]|uniref:DUF3300 domain-containing protein n=1 Tax=Pseudidiomarina insulisalsae TaxID=575789 RepID=A0A432YQE2_9GAMM|nr:DUF3300 domain-containing protein [Pseudidiomarina insulisalsae]RUO63542.1 hypothetical protein CWI71_00315 [Pseudidiomarina insulisalsae]
MRQFKQARLPLLKLSVVSLALAASVGCTTVPNAYAEAPNYTAYAVDGVYQRADLDRMLAPIALYPDSLLSHILIAATYPLEVVQAERWTREHQHLSAERALAAADAQDWDPSVKALVATPDVLRQMSEDLQWTQAVGEAFLAQQEDVLASIQLLRDRAYAAGNLRSDDHVAVARERDAIRIHTVRREIVYVPVYDSRYVYGSWWHHRPPVYWDGWGMSVSYGSGIRWSLSYHVPHWYFFSDFYWAHRYVVIHHHHYHDRHRDRRHRRDYYDHPRPGEGDRWRHDPRHRRNVDYRHRELVRNPPQLERKTPPGRVIGAPVKEERPPQVELRRRLLEAEAQPRMRRVNEPRMEQKPVAPVVRQQPRFESKPSQPVVRQQPRFESKPSQPVVRQQPRFESKPSQPVVRQQPRFESKPSQPVVRQQPTPVERGPVKRVERGAKPKKDHREID